MACRSTGRTGRVFNNIFVERLWRAIKYECLCVYEYESVSAVAQELTAYNTQRPHQSLGQGNPSIVKLWQANWARLVPMLSYPREIRRATYTTNTIELLNMMLRKINKNRALFPSDEKWSSNCYTWRCATSVRNERYPFGSEVVP